MDHHDDSDEDTNHSADGYMMHLTSLEFCFLLCAFYSIFAYSDMLFGILQNREFDMQTSDFDSIYEDTVSETRVPRGCRTHMQGDVRGQYQQLHSAIINNIVTQPRNKFNVSRSLE